MDWPLAIDRNREKLLRIILALMASLGLVDGGKLTTLPFYLYRKALWILRPAEAAVRRLIMMAAYEMELRGFNLAHKGRGVGVADGEGFCRGQTSIESGWHYRSFNLIDPLKPFTEESPDYSEFGPSIDDESASSNRTPTPAASLGRRLLALKNALDNVQKQARRLTRWYAIRDQALKQNQPHRMSPLRPGFPPGYRRKPAHEIEKVLLDCHSLAQVARERQRKAEKGGIVHEICFARFGKDAPVLVKTGRFWLGHKTVIPFSLPFAGRGEGPSFTAAQSARSAVQKTHPHQYRA